MISVQHKIKEIWNSSLVRLALDHHSSEVEFNVHHSTTQHGTVDVGGSQHSVG